LEDGFDSTDELFELGEHGREARTILIGQAALRLMESKSFGKQAQEFAMARVEALPEAPLFAAIVAEPLFARRRRSAGSWFRVRLRGMECAANHLSRKFGFL